MIGNREYYQSSS